MSERRISVGFKKPNSLEGDTIHIWLEKPGSVESIKAHAVSAVKFNYPVRAIDGHVLRETTTDATNEYGMRCNRYDSQQFIKEIVEENEGDIDYSETIEQGTNAFRAMREQLR